MIRHIIFDLDGVLVDARELHYEAMNRALAAHGVEIDRDEHLSTYDGLPTRQKLQLLSERKGLPVSVHDDIWKAKQGHTQAVIRETVKPDGSLLEAVRRLKSEGYTISVCSNSVRETVEHMLKRIGLFDEVEFFLSNEDVEQSKPHPEMYLRAILRLRAAPAECLVIEDSHHGREAAAAAGTHLCGVTGPPEVTYETIRRAIYKVDGESAERRFVPKWQGRNMNVVIPMAGEGKSFQKVGHTFPKPLIDVMGKPMVQWVVENLNVEARFIFVVRSEDYEQYNLKHLLNLIAPGCEIVQLSESTQGAVLSVLAAEKHFNDDQPLTVVNSDQVLEWNSNEFFYAMAADDCDAGLVTFESTHPKWSYVRSGEDGLVVEAAEKQVISKNATAGVYYYAKGSEFTKHARAMVEKNITTNGEFYVCPVFNEYVLAGAKIRPFAIEKLWSFSTPEDLEFFLAHHNTEDTYDEYRGADGRSGKSVHRSRIQDAQAVY